MALPTFQLVPTATNAAAPFCFGHTFKQGDVPAGSSVTAPFSDFQCIAKNAWPDGSLKFAILSGRASVTGTTALVSQLTVGAVATGTAIAASSISAVATIDCGTFGAATWSGTDWAAPFQTWISGPKMSSFIYRKPVGADAHLVGWLEVRVWSGGELEVLPWIENGYFRVASPTNKSATYSFTLGGTQRFSAAINLKHHARTPLVSGSTLAHWLGADPGVTPLPSPAYLQASEMVPSYSATMIAGAQQVAAQVTTYTPLQAGGFIYDGDSMPSSGYQSPIGLLPEHDVVYLVADPSDRVALYKSVQRNGYSAGRYGVHYRDETTLRPPAFSTYPTLVLRDDSSITNTGASTTGTYTPVTTGGNPVGWDTAHSPSMGYMAYLLTGRFYFKEEAQFAAITNHFCVTDWVRAGGLSGETYADFTGASGLCTSNVQTRAGAWWFRSLTQALAITPDSGDPLRTELKTVIEENIRYFHMIYVAQPNHPFGLILSSGGEFYPDLATDRQMVPIWMHDFVTMSWGAALCMGLPLSATAATKMLAYFQWRAKSIVHRLGTSSGWRFEQAGVYQYAASPSTGPNYYTGAGPWYADAATAYAASRLGYQNKAITDNALLFDIPQYGNPQIGIWANLIPAAAYAVRHQVTGAAAGYARLMGASNISTLTNGFNVQPVWSVTPSGATSESGGTLPTTPGPSFIWDSAPLVANSFIWDTYRGLGIPLSAVPSGGTNGTSVIRALIESGDNPNSEARVRYISTPTGFASAGDTSYTSPAGAINYEAYLDGASLGQATDTVGTGGGSDTTAPTMNGAISSSAITASSFTLSWPAASDNVAVTGYEVSIDGGSNYVNVGNVLTTNKTGLTASTGYATRVRAYDAANNKASPLIATVTTTATLPGIPGQKTFTIALGTGSTSAAANLTGLSVSFYDEQYPHQATTAKYQTSTGATNSLGVLSFTCQSSLASGQQGHVTIYGASGMHYNGMITAA